jgi:hypothetical protein
MPVSLALRTVERTPMVCAIETTLNNAQLKVVPNETISYEPNVDNPTPGAKRSAIKIQTFKIDPAALTSAFMGGKVKALVAFPFLRDDDANGNFEIDGRLSLFLSNPNLSFRTGGNDCLHLGVNADLQQPGVDATGVMNIPFTKQSWRPSNITKEEDALREFEFTLNQGAGPIAAWLQANDMATVRYRWEQTYTKISEDPPLYDWLPK